MYCPNCGSSDIVRHRFTALQLMYIDDDDTYFCNTCWSWFDAPADNYQLTMPIEGDQLTLEV